MVLSPENAAADVLVWTVRLLGCNMAQQRIFGYQTAEIERTDSFDIFSGASEKVLGLYEHCVPSLCQRATCAEPPNSPIEPSLCDDVEWCASNANDSLDPSVLRTLLASGSRTVEWAGHMHKTHAVMSLC